MSFDLETYCGNRRNKKACKLASLINSQTKIPITSDPNPLPEFVPRVPPLHSPLCFSPPLEPSLNSPVPLVEEEPPSPPEPRQNSPNSASSRITYRIIPDSPDSPITLFSPPFESLILESDDLEEEPPDRQFSCSMT